MHANRKKIKVMKTHTHTEGGNTTRHTEYWEGHKEEDYYQSLGDITTLINENGETCGLGIRAEGEDMRAEYERREATGVKHINHTQSLSGINIPEHPFPLMVRSSFNLFP